MHQDHNTAQAPKLQGDEQHVCSVSAACHSAVHPLSGCFLLQACALACCRWPQGLSLCVSACRVRSGEHQFAHWRSSHKDGCTYAMSGVGAIAVRCSVTASLTCCERCRKKQAAHPVLHPPPSRRSYLPHVCDVIMHLGVTGAVAPLHTAVTSLSSGDYRGALARSLASLRTTMRSDDSLDQPSLQGPP